MRHTNKKMDAKTAKALHEMFRLAADRFRDGDVVIVLKTNYAAIYNQEAIVADRRVIEKQIYLNLEFRGRIYRARPSQLENTGVNFYDEKCK